MIKMVSIVGTLAVIGLLTACGQKGPLALPTEAAAQNRATLPQLLNPKATGAMPPAALPASSPASAPRR